MPFHEKSAWIMSVALLLGGIFYVNVVADASAAAGQLAPPVIKSIVVYTVILVAVSIIGHTVIGILSPKEADAALDERERRIVERAGHWSAYLFGFGVVTSLGMYLFTGNGDMLFYAVFASLMLGQFAEYVVQIILYRTAVG